MAAKLHLPDLRERINHMHLPELHQNMGTTDRVVRTAIGSALVMNWLGREKPSMLCKIGGIIGGVFLLHGIAGWDPVLHACRTSTQAHDNRNVINKLRATRHNGGAKAIHEAQRRGKRLFSR